MTRQELHSALDKFAGGVALTLTMSIGGCWLRVGDEQWEITTEQADNVIVAMRCMQVEKQEADDSR